MPDLVDKNIADLFQRIETLTNALNDSQSLLVAMLCEKRPEDEIEDQIKKNRAVLTPGFFEFDPSKP